MTQEVLKLALEALEYASTGNRRPEIIGPAIAAIKEALAKEKALQALHNENERLGLYKDAYGVEDTLHWHALNYRTAATQNAQAMFEALEKFVENAIKEALAQPEQEPVEWGVDWGKDGNSVSIIKRLADGNIEVLAWEYAPHPPQRTERPVDCERCNRLEEQAYDLVGKLRVANIKLSMQPQRKPLPPQSPCEMTQAEGKMFKLGWLECEAAHGIKE